MQALLSMGLCWHSGEASRGRWGGLQEVRHPSQCNYSLKLWGNAKKKTQKTKNTKTKNKTKKPTTEAFSPWWESLPLYCRRLSLLDVYSTFVLSRRSTITFSFLDNEVLVSRSWASCFFCCPP